jgi:uncharacterized protein YjeT (DUF2065 family)
MHHLTAHAFPPDFLFHDWHEARRLWEGLLDLGTVQAAVLMPDHVHVVVKTVDRAAWLAFLRGYARWRNHHRAQEGRAVWLPAPPPEELETRAHHQRTLRYVALNPCRDHLAPDPLAWPFGTHRDAVGLAIPGVIPVVRDPTAWHAMISGDPSVDVAGTALPVGLGSMRAPTVEQVRAAVSALTRTPLADLRRRGMGRTLLIQALVECAGLSCRAVARELALNHTSVSRAEPLPAGLKARLVRVLGDPRFPALEDGPMHGSRAWRQYREHRQHVGAYDRLLAGAAAALARRGRARDRR